MSITKHVILFTSIYLFSNFSFAQNLKAVVGQVNQLQVKLENQNSERCNVEFLLPNGANSQIVISKPDYVANIEFNPTAEGLNIISWQGKFRIRGLSSVVGCDGNGKINVLAGPSNEIKIQRWKETITRLSEKQKACLGSGLKVMGENFDVNSPAGEIKNDTNEPISKETLSRCEKFADVVLQKKSVCKINDKQTLCDEYFETTVAGAKKQFMENELFEFLFQKEQVQKVSIENPEAKSKREISEADEQRKLEAYKKTPAYKKEQAELAKKEAIEDARIKKQQAELEKKRINDEAIAKKAAEEAAKQKIANMKEFVYMKPNHQDNTVSEEVFLDVCRKTKYWTNEYAVTAIRLYIGDHNAEQLIYSRGAQIDLQDIYVSKGNQCYLNFTVKGLYKGTSVNSSIFCGVTKIVKMENGGFIAVDYVFSSCTRQ